MLQVYNFINSDFVKEMWFVIFHIFFSCVLLNYNKKNKRNRRNIEKMTSLCYSTYRK